MKENQSNIESLRAMLEKAFGKLATARKDLEYGYFDDVCSRAYYGAFHAVSAVLAEKGLAFSSHAQTLGAFNREFVKSGIFTADTFRKLQRLYEDRQTGDYDLSRNIDRETAKKDLVDAEWLIDTCRKYLEEKVGQPLI